MVTRLRGCLLEEPLECIGESLPRGRVREQFNGEPRTEFELLAVSRCPCRSTACRLGVDDQHDRVHHGRRLVPGELFGEKGQVLAAALSGLTQHLAWGSLALWWITMLPL